MGFARETVKTVSQKPRGGNTGLKPGENETRLLGKAVDWHAEPNDNSPVLKSKEVASR